MKVYVASSFKTAHKQKKELIKKTIDFHEFKFFFPEKLGVHFETKEEMMYIDKACCEQLRNSEILLAIYPFGPSVSLEIGRFLENKFLLNQYNKLFVLLDTSSIGGYDYRKLRTEGMILSHVDYLAHSVDEVLSYLQQISISYKIQAGT